MATQKNTKKNTPQKEKRDIKWIENIRTFVKNETTQFISGLFCVMIGAYMILALSSFILNGGVDQSAIEQTGIAEQVSNAEQIVTTQKHSDEIKNSTGRSGAQIAHSLVNNHFGLSSYSIAAFLIV